MGSFVMPLTQGVQAVKSISQLSGLGKSDQFDLIIVDAGPAGIAAALVAKRTQRCGTRAGHAGGNDDTLSAWQVSDERCGKVLHSRKTAIYGNKQRKVNGILEKITAEQQLNIQYQQYLKRSVTER